MARVAVRVMPMSTRTNSHQALPPKNHLKQNQYSSSQQFASVPPPPLSDDYSVSTSSHSSNNNSISIHSTEFHTRPAKSKMNSSSMLSIDNSLPSASANPTAFSQYLKQAQQKAQENGEQPHALPRAPRHFRCPIQNTLLIDPVIDKEGNTYERDAILRWLVLTNKMDGNIYSENCGTSPITGNPINLKDLVDDQVVKSAIERWQKEVWVRYLLLENRGNGEGTLVESPEEDCDSSQENIDKRAKSPTPDKKKGGNTGVRGMRKENGMWVLAAGESRALSPLSGPSGLSDLEKVPTGNKKKKSASSLASEGSRNSKHALDASHKSTQSRGSKHRECKDEVNMNSHSIGASSLNSNDKTVRQNNSARLRPPPPKSSLQGVDYLSISKSSKGSKSKTPTKIKESNSQMTSVTAPTTPTSSSAPSYLTPSSPISNSKAPITTIIPVSSSSSFCSNLSAYDNFFTSNATHAATAHNGWSVPLGVHKIISSAPGLPVTTQVHRRSPPVRVPRIDINGQPVLKQLSLPPGTYVEILETEVHGDRVRGRVEWKEEVECEKKKKTKIQKAKNRTSRLLKRSGRRGRETREETMSVVTYEGWISLQWAKEEGEVDEDYDEKKIGSADEDAGPWTEPIPLGVYRINFGAGLPLRKTSERDSVVLGKLERGRCVEVVQTQVKGDRVRARVMVPQTEEEMSESGAPNHGIKYTYGWISLLNAMTGSSGASPVPLGAYVVVAEPGCVVTEGGRVDSKVKSTLIPGSCMEVVATRIEEGVVRGLIAAGGHVTLFIPPGSRLSSNLGASGNGRKNGDGGRMFAMPVPLGTYQIIQKGLSVTSGVSSRSQITMKLQLNANAEVVETRVEDGRVRGRICAVINEDGSRVVGYGQSGDTNGWINLFEPNQRWAKIIVFRGGRPVGAGQKRKVPPRPVVM